MKPCIAVLAFLMVPLGSPAAQTVIGELTRPGPGTRIRFTNPVQSSRREAVLVEWRGDSALARVDKSGEFVVIPPHGVAGIEVYDGMRSSAGEDALTGGAVGIGLARISLLSANGDEFMSPTTEEALQIGAFATVFSAGIGALVGSALKKPKWRPVSTDAMRLQAGVDSRGRVGLSVRVGF